MPHLAVALLIKPYPRQNVDERRIFLYFHFYYTADALCCHRIPLISDVAPSSEKLSYPWPGGTPHDKMLARRQLRLCLFILELCSSVGTEVAIGVAL